MSRWPTVQMRDLFTIEKGKVGIRAATAGKFPLVTTGELHLSHNEAHFSGDAVCIPMVSATGHGHASINRLHHMDGEFAVGSILCACINHEPARVMARYVFYYLTACKERVLIPLMQGSANVTLKLVDIGTLGIPLPPLFKQQDIVTRLDALAEKVRRVNEQLGMIEKDAELLLALRFRETITEAPMRTMAEIAPPIRRSVAIEIESRYREIGARSFGKGLFVKPDFEGAEVTWQKPVWIEAGDLVMSNIKAWEGAIAIARKEHAGCIASHRYITCVPDKNSATVGFLHYFLLSPVGLEQIGLASPGTADRNRTLSLTKLGNIEVPMPPLAIQKSFDALQAKVGELKAKHAAIREANQALVPAMLERIFKGGDHA